MQRVDGVWVLLPEPLTRPPHIPIRQRLGPFKNLIADELNVKDVELTDDIDTYGRFELTVNAKVAGPRLGKDVQAAIKAVKAGDAVVNADGTLTAGPAVLRPEEYSSRLVAADPEYTTALPDGGGLVVLDGTVTPELEAEGWARDLIRELQEFRRQGQLDVGDRIRLQIDVPELPMGWSDGLKKLIEKELLAVEFELNVVTNVNLRPAPDSGLDMQSGRVHREGDILTGTVGRGYPVKIERVTKA